MIVLIAQLRHLRRCSPGGPLRRERRHDLVRLAAGGYEHSGGGGWLSFGFGCVDGVVPWLAIDLPVLARLSVLGLASRSRVGILVSLFVVFNVFALNQWLQYRAQGRWQNYLLGEKGNIVLSLTPKSALAWQVFAGTLAA